MRSGGRPRFKVGDEISGYRIEGLVGVGEGTLVYRATDLRLGRTAALKVLVEELEGEGARRRFLRESELATATAHPNIIPVYAAGEVDGAAYIAMRFVEGHDLETLIERRSPLHEDEVLRIVEQVAAALDAAHARGLVHCDVKPGNILVERDTGHVFVTDFGIATETSSRGLSREGFFLGTIGYAAPEQIMGGALEPPVDVYALGCVLYEALAGRKPFGERSDVELLRAHIGEPPPALTPWRGDLAPAVDAVVARALAKAPGDRYRSCRELFEAARDSI